MYNSNTIDFETITSKESIDFLLKKEKGVLLYFYNDHCAPCHSLRPKIIHMQETAFPKMKLFFIDTERYPEIPAQHGIFSNPTILAFFEGKEYIRVSKYVSEHQLKENISRLYDMVFDD